MKTTLQGPTERQRIVNQKARQDHDADPPRCMNCVYFRREPHTKFIVREVRTRKGKLKTVRVPLKSTQPAILWSIGAASGTSK